MTKFFGSANTGVDDGTSPFQPGDASLRGGKVHALVSAIDLFANAVLSGDEIDWGGIPKGAVPLLAFFDTNRSLGSATIDLGYAIGATATAAYFKAAGTLTATDTPTPYMKGAVIGQAMASGVRVRSAVAAANMPANAGDRLTLVFLYTTPHSG